MSADLRPEVLPVAWPVIARTVAQAGEIELDALIDRITPPGMGEHGSRHAGPSTQWLLAAGVLVRGDGSKVLLAKDMDDDSKLRRRITSYALGLPEGADPGERSDRGGLVYHAPLGAAWIHLQGMEAGFAGFDEADEVLGRQLGADRLLLRNDVPYNSLVRLMVWCGVTAEVGGTSAAGAQVVPDPTTAIERELDELIGEGESVPAEELLKRCESKLPWLPGGEAGRVVREMMDEVPSAAPEAGEFSQGLAQALLVLELEGTIEIDEGDDPRERTTMLLSSGRTRAVARVRRKERQ